jgi:hypothetical protein
MHHVCPVSQLMYGIAVSTVVRGNPRNVISYDSVSTKAVSASTSLSHTILLVMP